MTELEMIERLAKIDDRSKANQHRLDKAEKRIAENDALIASIARIDQKQTDMDNDIKEIKTDVKSLAEKPGKRWEGLITTSIGTVAGGIIGAVLALILK